MKNQLNNTIAIASAVTLMAGSVNAQTEITVTVGDDPFANRRPAETSPTPSTLHVENEYLRRLLQQLLEANEALESNSTAPVPFIEMLPVGNAGNAGERRPGAIVGGIGYNYKIGKYEVTNDQYAYFLNRVAAVTDTYLLYDVRMGADDRGGIEKLVAGSSVTYQVRPNMGDKPVLFVSWFDTLRFCNWLHNGQPAGVQNDNTTEDGAYDLNGRNSVNLASGDDPIHGFKGRRIGANFWLPSESEWYKAAYYSPSPAPGRDNYELFPNPHGPWTSGADGSGNLIDDNPPFGPLPIQPFANLNYAADWAGLNGNVTTVGSAGFFSRSYYGAYDMVGNVSEWTEHPDRVGCVVRGGGWNSSIESVKNGQRAGIVHPASSNDCVGFRVAGR